MMFMNSKTHSSLLTSEFLSDVSIDKHDKLRDISNSSAGDNPKLQVLEQEILSCYNADDSKRGILFCKTREMTTALMNWMNDNPRLAILKPNILIGARNATRNSGTIQYMCYEHSICRIRSIFNSCFSPIENMTTSTLLALICHRQSPYKFLTHKADGICHHWTITTGSAVHVAL
jgi:hypothetical protein